MLKDIVNLNKNCFKKRENQQPNREPTFYKTGFQKVIFPENQF